MTTIDLSMNDLAGALVELAQQQSAIERDVLALTEVGDDHTRIFTPESYRRREGAARRAAQVELSGDGRNVDDEILRLRMRHPRSGIDVNKITGAGALPAAEPAAQDERSRYLGADAGFEDKTRLGFTRDAEAEILRLSAISRDMAGHSSRPLVHDLDADENGTDDGQPGRGGVTHAAEVNRLVALHMKLHGDAGNRVTRPLSPAAREAAERRSLADGRPGGASIPALAGGGWKG